MRVAKIIFGAAGVWGLFVITPMYFLYNWIGHQDPPLLNHPQFYFGFVDTAFAWQILFLILARDPVRYRLMMIPSILEKVAFVVSCSILYLNGQLRFSQAVVALPDLVLAVLFVIAFVKTSETVPALPDTQLKRTGVFTT